MCRGGRETNSGNRTVYRRVFFLVLNACFSRPTERRTLLFYVSRLLLIDVGTSAVSSLILCGVRDRYGIADSMTLEDGSWLQKERFQDQHEAWARDRRLHDTADTSFSVDTCVYLCINVREMTDQDKCFG